METTFSVKVKSATKVKLVFQEDGEKEALEYMERNYPGYTITKAGSSSPDEMFPRYIECEVNPLTVGEASERRTRKMEQLLLEIADNDSVECTRTEIRGTAGKGRSPDFTLWKKHVLETIKGQ